MCHRKPSFVTMSTYAWVIFPSSNRTWWELERKQSHSVNKKWIKVKCSQNELLMLSWATPSSSWSACWGNRLQLCYTLDKGHPVVPISGIDQSIPRCGFASVSIDTAFREWSDKRIRTAWTCSDCGPLITCIVVTALHGYLVLDCK